jgi:type IX secretion system PorP/SprF family membrane protein
MIRKVRLVIFSAIMLFWGISQAQDAQFSQFYANPLYLNPAFAGSVECGRINLNYRNQWPAMGNAYITYSASYDQFIPGINSGFGFLAVSDRQGDGALVRSGISGFYSYKLRVSNPIQISFGVEGTYYMEKLDWNKLIFADQIDPTTGNINPSSDETPPPNMNISAVDFSAGAIMYFNDQWFVGAAVDHMNQPDLSFYDNSDNKLPMRITAHGAVTVNLSQGMLGNPDPDDYVLQPAIMYMQQEDFHQLNFGLYLNKDPFVVGAWFRENFQNADAVIALIGISWDKIRVGYSYDFTISNLGGSTGGAHEITFAWDFCIYKQAARRKIRAIKAPSF